MQHFQLCSVIQLCSLIWGAIIQRMFTLFASRGLFRNLPQKPIELLASVGVIHFTFSSASVLKVILISAVNNERGN